MILFVVMLCMLALVVQGGEVQLTNSYARKSYDVLDRSDRDLPLELMIVVKQKNTQHLEEELLKVSMPSSPMYGQHWTEEQVVEFLGGAESDEVILSPFHKANIGNIVFTNTEMAPKDITAADIVNEFSIIVANLTIIIRVTFLKIITEKTDLTIKALIESIDRDIIVGSGNNQRLD